MPTAKIYHNPRCSKSRATLELLVAKHDDVEVIKYLEYPPTVAEIKSMLQQLGLGIHDILRKNEAEFKANDMANPALSTEQLLALAHQFPKVLERPIVTFNNQAIIGRPPENVLGLFE
ncbi:arsenate reductase (glutaredoxin) [Marinicella litoralis]|uniref:Arsenate reductase n=1 Tax=Marinicella litoralis TaxID=644220 RepID=A0A4R6XMK7_9GAMM|nr:arsenate reductase (glutaredoxin) [Marinicella litoralis]TDR19609.1 arsenate reductase [Marinicella litoralis]